MADLFSSWAATVRAQIQEDIKWLEGGGKALSPSGDDITTNRIESLKLRLEHANKIMGTLLSPKARAEKNARLMPSALP